MEHMVLMLMTNNLTIMTMMMILMLIQIMVLEMILIMILIRILAYGLYKVPKASFRWVPNLGTSSGHKPIIDRSYGAPIFFGG